MSTGEGSGARSSTTMRTSRIVVQGPVGVVTQIFTLSMRTQLPRRTAGSSQGASRSYSSVWRSVSMNPLPAGAGSLYASSLIMVKSILNGSGACRACGMFAGISTMSPVRASTRSPPIVSVAAPSRIWT